MRRILEVFSLGFDPVSENLEDIERSLPQSGPFAWGKTTGDVVTLATGILAIILVEERQAVASCCAWLEALV